MTLGCAETKPDPSRLGLSLKLPETFGPNTARFAQLMGNFRQTNVHLETGEGEKHDWVLGRASFPKAVLSPVPFPLSRKDHLSIEVEVWDRRRDGTPRTTPIFRGNKKLSYADFRSLRGDQSIEVVLHAAGGN